MKLEIGDDYCVKSMTMDFNSWIDMVTSRIIRKCGKTACLTQLPCTRNQWCACLPMENCLGPVTVWIKNFSSVNRSFETDWIGKTENLINDSFCLSRVLGIGSGKIDFTHNYLVSSDKKKSHDDYNDTMRKVVRELYDIDFRLFYSK